MDTTTKRSLAVVMKDTRTLADVSVPLCAVFRSRIEPCVESKAV